MESWKLQNKIFNKNFCVDFGIIFNFEKKKPQKEILINYQNEKKN